MNDLEQLADAAFDEAQRHAPRSAGRRAASHVWVAMTIPPVKTLASARNAVASFGAPEVQAAALELLTRLAGAVTAAGPNDPVIR